MQTFIDNTTKTIFGVQDLDGLAPDFTHSCKFLQHFVTLALVLMAHMSDPTHLIVTMWRLRVGLDNPCGEASHIHFSYNIVVMLAFVCTKPIMYLYHGSWMGDAGVSYEVDCKLCYSLRVWLLFLVGRPLVWRSFSFISLKNLLCGNVPKGKYHVVCQLYIIRYTSWAYCHSQTQFNLLCWAFSI